jgi:hypothetical protein
MRSKTYKYIMAVLLGVTLSFVFSYENEAEASTACFYSYCWWYNGTCQPNYNATNCYGVGGVEPCTSTKPCSPPPDPGEG